MLVVLELQFESQLGIKFSNMRKKFHYMNYNLFNLPNTR